MDGEFPVGDAEKKLCVICEGTETTRRIDMGRLGTGPEGPFSKQPVCTDCLSECMELGDEHCRGDPCVCTLPDSKALGL